MSSCQVAIATCCMEVMFLVHMKPGAWYVGQWLPISRDVLKRNDRCRVNSQEENDPEQPNNKKFDAVDLADDGTIST